MKRASTGSTPDGNQQIAAPANQPAGIPEKPTKRTTASKSIPLTALIAYKEQGLTNPEIAAIVGCSTANVQQRLADADIQGFDSFRKSKDVILEHLQYKFISLVSEAQIKNMLDRRGLTDMAILEDKIRAIRGQNDSNVKPMIVIVKGDNAQVQVNGIAKPSSTLATQVIDTTSNDVSNE